MLRNAILSVMFIFGLPVVQAEDEFTVPVEDEELSIQYFPARGSELIIWVAPGFPSSDRVFTTAKRLAAQGVEVWHVDLAESLFLTSGTATMRRFDGRYIAGLIDAAYEKTGKRITLLSRTYGTLPVLKGARLWQRRHAHDGADYLNGAILFSPDAYVSVPALGLPPEYDPIITASNIPIIIYQGGSRGNRWQLPNILDRLYETGSQVFVKIMPGVTGLFYEGDTAPATLRTLQHIPQEIPAMLSFLGNFAVPENVVAIEDSEQPQTTRLDIVLKPYLGDPQPLQLDLYSATGEHVVRRDYRGKVTVVNFWATWCPPCVEEIPSLNNLRKKMQGKNFELISVNYAEDKQVIDKFLQRVNVDFPVLLDTSGRVSVDWGVIAYPSTFVIGPDGTIVYGVNAAIHWDSAEVVAALDALLKE